MAANVGSGLLLGRVKVSMEKGLGVSLREDVGY